MTKTTIVTDRTLRLSPFVALPPEIHYRIFLFADQATLKSLCLCNKLLLSRAQTALFQTSYVHFNPDLPHRKSILDKRSLALQQCLLANADFRERIQLVRMAFGCFVTHQQYFKGPDPSGSIMFTKLWDVGRLFTNVRLLHLEDGLGPSIPGVPELLGLWTEHCSQTMTKVSEVHFNRLGTAAVIPCLKGLQKMTQLRKLKMHLTAGPYYVDFRRFVPSDQHVALQIDPDYGCESLYELSIFQQTHVKHLAMILPWCKRLALLTLCDLSFFSIRGDLQSMLSDFMVTQYLKELYITVVVEDSAMNAVKPTLSQLQISQISSLYKFTIRDWLPGPEDGPVEIHKAFFAGNLRQLEWSFNECTHGSYITTTLTESITSLTNALSYAIAEESSLQGIECSFGVSPVGRYESDARKAELRAIKKEIKSMQKELSKPGILANCYGYLVPGDQVPVPSPSPSVSPQ